MKHPKRLFKKKTKDQPESGGRITNETVAEHREQILAGGRKFKYPVQYSKHKLLINTAIIAVVTVVLGSILLWYQLYVAQSTSNITYRITQLLPLPVATIDGQSVRYSNYLMKYRSSIHFLEAQDNFNLGTEDGKRQAAFVSRQQLDTAIKDAYVEKIAKEKDISVSSEEVSQFIENDLESKKVSQRAFERTVLDDYYGWSLGEYRSVVKMSLLKRKVSFAIDDVAKKEANDILSQLRKGTKFATVAKKSSDDAATKANGGEAGTVTLDSPDPDGIIEALDGVNEGKFTSLIQGRDGYYIAKLDDRSTKSIRYSIIKIDLTKFDAQFEKVKDSDKTEEFIDIKE